MSTSTNTDRRWRFTWQDVRRMVASGVLDEDAPVELLGGDLVELRPQGPVHGGVHRHPGADGYGRVEILATSETVQLQGQELSVASLFPVD